MNGFTPNSRYNRPIDCGPACDIHRADVVGVIGETTRLATEQRLAQTVPFIKVLTTWTGPASVLWVDCNHRNTRQLAFVLDKRSELKECPSGMDSSLALRDSYPVSDALEILKGNASTGAFSLGDYTFRDDMVRISSEPSFSTREFPEMPLSGLGSCGLEPCLEDRQLPPNRFYSITASPL